MLRFDVIGSAFAISVFLLLYYILVGFAVVYFATVYGYTPARANALANWYWITNAIALVVTGVLTDRFRVRKPFMIIGTVDQPGRRRSCSRSPRPTRTPSYYTIAVYFILSLGGGGMAYVAWMASFTETVEQHNPAATATGLAIWGWILRLVVTVSLAVFTLVVPATSILVDKGTPGQEIVAAHPDEVGDLSRRSTRRTSKALAADPTDVGRAVHGARRGRHGSRARATSEAAGGVHRGHHAGAAAGRGPGDRPGDAGRAAGQPGRPGRRRRRRSGRSAGLGTSTPATAVQLLQSAWPRPTCRPTWRWCSSTPPS